MSAERLAGLIQTEGGIYMAQVVDEFARQLEVALGGGWDLAEWTITQASGVILFRAVELTSLPDPKPLGGGIPNPRGSVFGRAVVWPGDPDYPANIDPVLPPDDLPIPYTSNAGKAAAMPTILCVYADESKRGEYEAAAPPSTIVLMRDQWFRADQMPEQL